MNLFNHVPFDPSASHNLSAEFLEVRKNYFTKKQMSAFANKLFNYALWRDGGLCL